MKKTIVSFTGLLLFFSFLMCNPVDAGDNVLGTWSFNVNQAPWEYNSGKIIIETDDEDELVGRVVFDSGIEMRIARISRDEERVRLTVWIEGTSVYVVGTVEEDELTGRVETIEGNLPFSAKREVPEE